jgi:hypothetical protein
MAPMVRPWKPGGQSMRGRGGATSRRGKFASRSYPTRVRPDGFSAPEPCVGLILKGVPQLILRVAERPVLIHAARHPDVCGIVNAQHLPGVLVRVVIVVACT